MDELKPSPANSFPLTPLGFLERAATVYGDCLSIVYNNTEYTWSQTHRRCLQLASSIFSIIGDLNGKYPVVSVVAPNIPAMYELHFAVPMAGAVLNNINTRQDARTISILLRHSESKLVFVDCLIYSVVLEAVSLFPPNVKRPFVVLITDDDLPSLSGGYKNVPTYNGLVEKGDPHFKWIRPQSELDPIVLNYTSGTTSAPKGVVHCHRGSFITTLDTLVDWSISKRPVFLWTLPMFHSNGWSFTWGMAVVGGTNICLRKIDAKVIYSLIRKHCVTHMCGAPVVMNMLANGSPQPLKSPVHVLTGGSPPPAPDIIITGGENLSSVEVESVLYTNPAINEAAVVARPDEFWGETPCAFVNLRADINKMPTEKEIIEYCRARLPHYMAPKTVVFFNKQLPKTATGKIQKFVLREKAKALGQSPISRY
ncbi:hypothetical protein ACFE04_001367 [Oxalis oulophora]